VSEEEVRSSLLTEIESALGTGSATHRLDKIEAQLQPIFLALPKNEHGKLGHTAGRYALHRLFVSRHGWKIKGIDSNDGSWNSSSPAGVLKDQVPAYVQNLFEERLGGQGLGLHELAILASTIEHLIHKETSFKLGAAFEVHGRSQVAILDEANADKILETYMMAYIMGESLINMSYDEAESLKAQLPDMFVAWKNTRSFVRGVRLSITQSAAFDFETMTKIADRVGEQFGSFFSTQCSIMKEKLISMGIESRGRVPLANFYRSNLDGAWQFQESVSYLRQLGALDESDPKAMSVVIPNYVYSQTNCIPSGFYSVCCKDECAGLLGHLEERLATPEATPEAITAVAKDLVSSTMSAPLKISTTLSERLEEIAATHGGVVPLHGRLFAQWMHHAFPRECPFPHVAGTTNQQAPDDWLVESGSDPLATQEEMQQLSLAPDATSRVEESQKAMPWFPEEELHIPRATPPKQSSARSIMRIVMLFGVILSALYALLDQGLGVMRHSRKTPAITPHSKFV
jgi:hypothetical protein